MSSKRHGHTETDEPQPESTPENKTPEDAAQDRQEELQRKSVKEQQELQRKAEEALNQPPAAA